MSIGFSGIYLLGVEEIQGDLPNFDQRFDIKTRLNVNIGDVIGLSDYLDVYPGLNLGFKNFGAHYFFTEEV
jgi:hypothetical protein